MLKTALLQKAWRKDFFVLRTSIYDDVKNGVDNILIERKTGAIACVVDVVAETTGQRLYKKKKEIRDRNLRGGANLKYGLEAREKEGGVWINLGPLGNVPVFYLCANPRLIEISIRNFTPGLSEYDKNMIRYFKELMEDQILEIRRTRRGFNPGFERRLSTFEKKLKETGS